MADEKNNERILLDFEKTSKNIAKLIQESGLSDKQIADEMNVSIQAVNRWRHHYKNLLPSTENLYLLARSLGVSVDSMLISTRPELANKPPKREFSFDVLMRRFMAIEESITIDGETGKIKPINKDENL